MWEVAGQEERGLSTTSNALPMTCWAHRTAAYVKEKKKICVEFLKWSLWRQWRRPRRQEKKEDNERRERKQSQKEGAEREKGLRFHTATSLVTTSVYYLDKPSQLLKPSGYPTIHKPALFWDSKEDLYLLISLKGRCHISSHVLLRV